MTIEHVDQAAQQQIDAQKTPVALSRPLADIDQAWRLANALSQSSLIPSDLRNKASNVLVLLMYGQELGLSPMQSIQGIYVVNGRPQMSGQLWLALIRKAGHRVQVSDSTDKTCTVTITRGDTGETHTETFTLADAQRAKLDKKDTYLAWPKQMLTWRAVANCARVACPEVALGFEMQGDDFTDTPSPEAALAHAVDARTTPAPTAVADVDEGAVDAEVVEDLAAADEQARAEMLAMQSQFTGGEWPETAPLGGES